MSVIDEYLQDTPVPQRTALEHVRALAKQVAPDAVDTIGYGMPVLKLGGVYLIGFASFKNHMSIFPGGSATQIFEKQLKDLTTSKGAIQFTVDNPIPDHLLKDIVQVCVDRINERKA